MNRGRGRGCRTAGAIQIYISNWIIQERMWIEQKQRACSTMQQCLSGEKKKKKTNQSKFNSSNWTKEMVKHRSGFRDKSWPPTHEIIQHCKKQNHKWLKIISEGCLEGNYVMDSPSVAPFPCTIKIVKGW